MSPPFNISYPDIAEDKQLFTIEQMRYFSAISLAVIALAKANKSTEEEIPNE